MESTEFILFRLLPPLALIISLAWALNLLISWRKAPVPLDRGLARGLGLGPWGMLLPWRGRFSLFQRLAVGAVVCCLGVLAARHARYFVSPAPLWSPFWAGPSLWAGIALTLLIVFFWMRRMLDERAALLTGWREHLGSGLFLLCAASGVALRWWGGLNIDAARAAAGGMFLFGDAPLPRTGFLFCLHFVSALALLALLPKYVLPRLAGRFFNPALRRTGKGHAANPWAADFAGDQISPSAARAGEPKPYTLEQYRSRLKRHWEGLGSGRVASAGERSMEERK